MKSQKKAARPPVKKTSLTKGTGVPPVPGSAADHVELPDGSKARTLELLECRAHLHKTRAHQRVCVLLPLSLYYPLLVRRCLWAYLQGWTRQWRRR